MDCHGQLLEAAKKKDVNKIKQLLPSGACPNIRELYYYDTALHLLFFSSSTNVDDKEILEAADVLIRSGAMLDCVNQGSYTPLAIAVITNRYAVAKMLLEAGACVDLPKDKRVRNVKPEMAALLSKWGATFHLKVQPHVYKCDDILHNDTLRMEEVNTYVRCNNNANIRIKVECKNRDVTLQTRTVEKQDYWDDRTTKRCFPATTMTALHYATINHYHDAMNTLVNCGANPNTRDSNGRSSLEHLLDDWNDTTFEILVAGRVNLNVGTDGWTGIPCFIRAVKDDKDMIATKLMKAGANVNISEPSYFSLLTPLHHVVTKNSSMAKQLIAAGANVKARDKNLLTPLHHAVTSKSQSIVKQLIAAGANVDDRDKNLLTPLHRAVINKSLSIAKQLIEARANVNARDKNLLTPLHHVTKRSVSIAKQLIAAGANVNGTDKTGNTPLFLAMKQNSLEMIEVLVNAGASMDIHDKDFLTPLHHVVAKKSLSLTKQFIAAGANVNDRDETGKTALFFAVEQNSPEMIELLVNAGASMDIQDQNGLTPYSYSSKLAHEKASKRLIEYGVHKCDTAFQNQVFIAANFGDTNVLEAAASAAENLNFKDKNGRTPLHIAVLKQSVKAVEILINGGADINSQDKWETTPLEDAQETRNAGIVNLLNEASATESNKKRKYNSMSTGVQQHQV